MQSFENPKTPSSRTDALRVEIEALRMNKIANASDPKFAAEIQEEIEARQAELDDLETRH